MWLPRPRCAPPRRSGATLEASRRCPLTVEALEFRTLPSIAFHFTLNDPNNEFAPFPLLEHNLETAGQILAADLQGQGTIEVLVQSNNSIDRSSGSTVGVVPAGSQGDTSLFGSAALAAVQTGRNPNGDGPEIELDLNTQTYLPTLWFDPSDATHSEPAPSDRVDFISVAVHEMTHALGFQGYRAITGTQYGQLPAGYESVYDSLTQFGAGGDPNVLYFVGHQAEAVYGGPVPLTTVGPSAPLSDENFYHVGEPQGAGSELAGVDLMNGVVFRYGTRYTPSSLDLAMLADMGWSVSLPLPSTSQPPAPPQAPGSTTAPGTVLPAETPTTPPTVPPSPTTTGTAPLTGDVSGVVHFLVTAYRVDRRHHRLLETVVVSNDSAQPLLGPLTLVLASSARPGASLRKGRTMASALQHLPVTLLSPGQTATFTLVLNPAGVVGPASSLHLLAGPGDSSVGS